MSSQHQRKSTRLELVSDVLTADFERWKNSTSTKGLNLCIKSIYANDQKARKYSSYSLENELFVVLQGQLIEEKGFHISAILISHLSTVLHSSI